MTPEEMPDAAPRPEEDRPGTTPSADPAAASSPGPSEPERQIERSKSDRIRVSAEDLGRPVPASGRWRFAGFKARQPAETAPPSSEAPPPPAGTPASGDAPPQAEADAFHTTDTAIFRLTAAEVERLRKLSGQSEPVQRPTRGKIRKLALDVQELRGPATDEPVEPAEPGPDARPSVDDLAKKALAQLGVKQPSARSLPPQPNQAEELVVSSVRFDEPPAESSVEPVPVAEARAPTGNFFELVRELPQPGRPTRACATLEIKKTRLRYLELQPSGGVTLVTRFEEVKLVPAAGMRFADHVPNVGRALGELRERLGPRTPPCTVLLEQEYATPSVITLPPGDELQLDAAVEREVQTVSPLPAAENLIDRKVLADLRIGGRLRTAAMVVYSARTHVGLVLDLLKAHRFPVGRITSPQVSFLETLVPAASQRDRDSADAFLFVNDSIVTIGMAARGVLLMTRNFKLRAYDEMDEFLALLYQLSIQLKRTAIYFQRTCRGGEVGKIHYLSATPIPAPFTLESLSKSFQRPVEVLEPATILGIDAASIQAHNVPVDAISTLAAPALAGAPHARGVIDLLPREHKLRPIKRLAWAVSAGLAVVAMALLAAVDLNASRAVAPLRQERAHKEQVREGAEAVLRSFAPMEELHARVEQGRTALATLHGSPPDARALLLDLAARKPKDLYVAKLRLRAPAPQSARLDVVGAPPPAPTWSLEIVAVAVADRYNVDEVISDFMRELAKSDKLVEPRKMESTGAEVERGMKDDILRERKRFEFPVMITASVRQPKEREP